MKVRDNATKVAKELAKKDGLCLICGIAYEETELCGHHIITVGSDPSLADKEYNIITVCHECHRAIHDGYIDIKKHLLKWKGTDVYRWEEIIERI